jgi:hypothetical protein
MISFMPCATSGGFVDRGRHPKCSDHYPAGRDDGATVP